MTITITHDFDLGTFVLMAEDTSPTFNGDN